MRKCYEPIVVGLAAAAMVWFAFGSWIGAAFVAIGVTLICLDNLYDGSDPDGYA